MKNDPIVRHGRELLELWWAWAQQQDARGYPADDSITRVAQLARTATEKQGAARWAVRGKEPPQMPKETRANPGSQIPRGLDHSRLGPQISRLLLDLDGMGAHLTAHACRVDAKLARLPEDTRRLDVRVPREISGTVELLPVSLPTYRQLVRSGCGYIVGGMAQMARLQM